MSQAVFPSFIGLMWGSTKTPIWKTLKRETVSGKELRVALSTTPRYRYTLSYEVLRSASAYAELQSLVGFFNARRGSWDDFLYTDPDDNVVTTATFGTGDGVTTVFKLARTFGGFTEPVGSTNGTPSIYKNGVLQSSPTNYTLDPTSATVTFSIAPAPGDALTWTGSYYWRVRFVKDEVEFTQFLKNLWEAKRIELITVK